MAVKTLHASNALHPPLRLGPGCRPRSLEPWLDALLGEGLALDGWQGRFRSHHATHRRYWSFWLLSIRLLSVMQYVRHGPKPPRLKLETFTLLIPDSALLRRPREPS